MIRRIAMTAFALLLAAPLAAQAPAGYQLRIDKSTDAADPDNVPDVGFVTEGSGFKVTTGPAAVIWKPENSATGNYTLKGRFTLLEPSNHTNYYGFVFGGSNLNAASQSYLYFLVAQNGSFIVKHRAGEEVHDVVGRTMHDAVVKPDAGGKSVNDLEVRVAADKIDFVVNGTVVHSQPKSGMAARTDGTWGVRINHVLPGVVVENLEIVR